MALKQPAAAADIMGMGLKTLPFPLVVYQLTDKLESATSWTVLYPPLERQPRTKMLNISVYMIAIRGLEYPPADPISPDFGSLASNPGQNPSLFVTP